MKRNLKMSLSLVALSVMASTSAHAWKFIDGSSYNHTDDAGHYVTSGTVTLDLTDLVVEKTGNAWGVKVTDKAVVNATGSSLNVTATTQNGSSSALDASLVGNASLQESSHSGTINMGDKNTKTITLTATGTSATTISAMRNVNWAEPAPAFVNLKAETVVINATATGNTSGNYGVGIWVQNNTGDVNNPSKVTIDANHTTITTKSGYAQPDVAGEYTDIGIVAYSGGQVEITGGLTINSRTAISTRGGSVIQVNSSGMGTVQMNGDIIFYYDGPTSGTTVDADVTVNLTGTNSYFNGNVFISGNPQPPDGKNQVGGMVMNISNGAQWTTTAASFTNELTLNEGRINVNSSAGEGIVVDKMSGTGGTITLAATTDGATVQASEFVAKETEGTMNLTVSANGISADDITDATAALASLASKVAVDGASKTSEIAEGDILGKISSTIDSEGKAGAVVTETNTKQDAYQTLTATNILAWRHDMNDLTKRMGELRDSPEGVGAWARVYGSEQESGSQNMLTKSTSIQVGGDVDVGNGWKVGVAFSYTDSDTSYSLGSADSDSYAAAVYGSWLAENGQFVDLIAKYTRMSSDFTLNGFDGSNDNNAFSVSAEYGWHFPVNDIAFVEPQVELTYGHISGDKFASNSGTMIDQDDYESLIGRAGLRFGFYFPEHRGTIYARVSGVYDFMGEYEYTATKPNLTKRFKDDLGGAWVEYAVGANFNWTENTYTYVDLERTSGGEVKENYRWNIGLRHVF